MSNFALNTTDPYGDIISSINYLLATTNVIDANANVNLGNALVANVTSGQITTAADANYVSYLFEYLHVRYADNATGSVNFSTSPTNRLYYGLRNSSSTVGSSNPADYIWTQVVGGFGTTKFFFYSILGGRQLLINITTAATNNFLQAVDAVPIDLDLITAVANVVITANNIVNGSITGNKVASSTLTGNLVAPSTLTGKLIAASTITGNLIQSATITGNLIAAATITGNLITANTITGNLITANTITGNKITASTITGNLIAASTITGNLISANTITGNLITASTITGNLISANTITGNLIAANTITANLITANSITATQIQTGTLTTNLFTANTINANIITGGTITADKLAANVLTVNTVISTGATFGSNSSAGFWLDGPNGNARFGNGISVGNNLTVGNNAVIGGNLAVNGLITSGNLIANTVVTTTIIPNSVTSTASAYTATLNQLYPVSGTFYNSGANVSVTTTTGNTTVLLFGQLATELSIANVSVFPNNSATIVNQLIRYNSAGANVVLNLDTEQFTGITTGGAAQYVDLTTNWIGVVDTLTVNDTYTYTTQSKIFVFGPNSNAVILSMGNPSITSQELKR